MLLVTVCIWAFNFTVTKYVLTHGFAPLAYSSVRYGAAAALFAVPPDRMVLRKTVHELADPGAELVRELRRCRPDERVDGVDRRLRHRRKSTR